MLIPDLYYSAVPVLYVYPVKGNKYINAITRTGKYFFLVLRGAFPILFVHYLDVTAGIEPAT